MAMIGKIRGCISAKASVREIVADEFVAQHGAQVEDVRWKASRATGAASGQVLSAVSRGARKQS
jgi:hypothetical protein